MNIFISWSGERSRQVAELMKQWVKCVIQSTSPWISTKDIERGSLWAAEIGNQLQDTTNGIICLTKENKNAPWILFEAGALAKGLQSSRIYTILVDLDPADVTGPLAQFNHTKPIREDMFKLIRTINLNCTPSLESDVLERTFDAFWDFFQKSYQNIILNTEDVKDANPPSQNDANREILSTLRNIQSRLSDIESNPFNSIGINSTLQNTGGLLGSASSVIGSMPSAIVLNPAPTQKPTVAIKKNNPTN